MDGLLLAIIAGDAIAGFLCLRVRKFRHAVVLGGFVIPAALIVATLMFAALDNNREGLPKRDDEIRFLFLAYGAISVAALAVAWMLIAGIGTLWRDRFERPRAGR